jgi:hypothetical protein
LNNAPIQENVDNGWTPAWSAFFTQLVRAIGWVNSWSYKFTLDFGSIPANSESSGMNVTISGVKQGDSVNITPYTNTVGISYKGLVTSDNNVTIYAINHTSNPINPASMQYNIIVLQN